MALPTILIDSGSGSDTAASGAGPATALTGASASTDATGLIVTLDGSPDLTGVATDGSHVIFLNDSTAGKRNFGKITAKDNVAKTVTVADAFALSASGKAWAIGGKRASIGGATSSKLVDNNSTAGDAKGGWIIEFQSGHSESFTGRLNIRCAGDTTNGPIIIRGASGGTRPVLSWNTNDIAIVGRGNYCQLRFLELKNTSGTKTSAAAYTPVSGVTGTQLDDLKIADGTSYFGKGIDLGNSTCDIKIINCEIANTTSYGIVDSTGAGTSTSSKLIVGNYIHNTGGNAIDIAGNLFGLVVYGNIIATVTGDGIHINSTRVDSLPAWIIAHNDIYNCSSDGIQIDGTSQGIYQTAIFNNFISTCGAYGINFGSAGTAAINANSVLLLNNAFFSNTSGETNPSGISTGTQSACDPQNASYASGGDFSKGSTSNAKANGFATTNIGKGSTTRSYVDIGAAQRQEPAAGPLPGAIVIQNIGTY